jgi:hypothetical protein
MGKMVCFLAFFAMCGLLFADVIYLKDGRKIEGKIIRETEDEVVVKMKFTELPISKADIEKIERTAGEPEEKADTPKAPVEKPAEKPEKPKEKPAVQPQPEKPKVPEGCLGIADVAYFKLISAQVEKLKWVKQGSNEKMDVAEDFLAIRFALTNSGKETLIYVPAHSRLEEVHRGRDEKNNVCKQAGTGEARLRGYFPEGACTETVAKIEQGKSVEDIIVFLKPKPEAEKIILTIETEALLLTDYGYIEIEIPLLLGSPDPTKQPTAKFTEKAREKTELNVKGEAKIANAIAARLLSAEFKRVSAVSKEHNMVVTAQATSLVLKFAFENKTSKSISYMAFLAPEFGMHVVARDDQGRRYGMLGLSGFDLCEAKSGLPNAIKAKETITDLLIIEPPQVGAKFITIIAITDFLFPKVDKFAGLLMAKIPLNNGKIDREKSSYIKFVHQELVLEQKTIIDIVDEWSTADRTKWDDKYCGSRVSGKGKVFNNRYIEEFGCTEVLLMVGENALKQATYVIEIIVPGCLTFRDGDDVQYKGVIWGAKSEQEGSVTVLALQVFGISVKK